jgi:lysine 2,3-aminomutase
MAGFLENIIKTRNFKTNSYINNLLEKARDDHGEVSSEFKGIYNQYFKIPSATKSELVNRRHYEAAIVNENIPKGLERLYRRSVVIDLLSACVAECIYCLRGYYDKFVLSNSEIKEIVLYCAKEDQLQEVLITGGDPLISPVKLKFLITELALHAPNIKIIRIGTRLPVQDPENIDATIFPFFQSMSARFQFEIGLQVNHYFEFQHCAIDVIHRFKKAACTIYCQNVLLKDVNDDVETLVRLYDNIRYLGLMPHYLFHAVPMIGTDDFRTSVRKGIDLIRQLDNSGKISGRAKPYYALMTDVGKVTLYHDTIIGHEGKYLILKTNYKISDRLKWNPSYKLPATANVNRDDTITVKYLDALVSKKF